MSKKNTSINIQDLYKKSVGLRPNKAVLTTQERKDVYYTHLYQLALARYTWEGLPKEISERFVETTLLTYGAGAFYHDDLLNRWIFMTYTSESWLNSQLEEVNIHPYGGHYDGPTLKPGQYAIVYDNLSRIPLWETIDIYAQRLANLDRAMDVNITSLTQPTIIVVDEKQKLTVQNMIAQKEDGYPYIFAYNSLDPSSLVQVYPNTAPYLVDKILQAKAQTINEFLSIIGVQNSTEEKGERLITDEVTAGGEKVNIWRMGSLKARQQGCMNINKTFPGLNVSVHWSDMSTTGMFGQPDMDKVAKG